MRRRLIATAYKITHHISISEHRIKSFAYFLEGQGVVRHADVQKITDRLIYRVFDVVFVATGMATSNSAHRYARGLEGYLKSGAEPLKVKRLVMKFGPEKLYDAVEKRKTLEVALAYKKAKDDVLSETVEDEDDGRLENQNDDADDGSSNDDDGSFNDDDSEEDDIGYLLGINDVNAEGDEVTDRGSSPRPKRKSTSSSTWYRT